MPDMEQKPRHIPTFILEKGWQQFGEEINDGPRIVEEKVGLSVAEQISTFFKNNPRISQEQVDIIYNHGYDEQAVLDHFDKTGEMPIGRMIGEDYFEIYDKNKVLLTRYKMAQQKMAQGGEWQYASEPSDSNDAVTSAINNESNIAEPPSSGSEVG